MTMVERAAKAIARAEHDALQVGGVGDGLEGFDPEAASDCYMDHARAALLAALDVECDDVFEAVEIAAANALREDVDDPPLAIARAVFHALRSLAQGA